MNSQELIDNAVRLVAKCGCQDKTESLEWHKEDILRYYHEPDTQWCTKADNDAALEAIDKCIQAGLGDAKCITAEEVLNEQIDAMASMMQEKLDDANDRLSSRVRTQERLNDLMQAHKLMNEVLTSLL